MDDPKWNVKALIATAISMAGIVLFFVLIAVAPKVIEIIFEVGITAVIGFFVALVLYTIFEGVFQPEDTFKQPIEKRKNGSVPDSFVEDWSDPAMDVYNTYLEDEPKENFE